jgi:curved DNA-binding protein CbpA
MLRKIEEAYEVLSNTERRKEYDRHHGWLRAEDELAAFSRQGPGPGKKIISIDRVPPMETLSGGDDLLVAPKTDFGGSQTGARDEGGFFGSTEAPLPTGGGSPGGPRTNAPQKQTGEARGFASAPQPGGTPSFSPGPKPDVSDEIAREAEWQGSFIRRMREARRVSVEELSAVTKITKTYIQAIEEENFGRLPAAVYLRGFVIQIAKVLKLPHEKVAGGYMARYYQARPDQAR